MIKLNERLLCVAKMVDKGSNAIDVGCDHAYLSIYLKENKIVNNIIASDNKEGPLKEALKNIKNSKVNIKTSLADGISKIDDITDTVIVSGMGGGNIIGMFKYTPNKLKNVNTLILSPNNETKRLRKEICKLGYYIIDEELVKYKNIIYPVIKFKRGHKFISYNDYMFGPILIKKNNSLFKELCERDLKQKEIILKLLPNNYFLKKLELKYEIKQYNKYTKKR